MRAMVFIDFENFDIAKNNYYKNRLSKDTRNQNVIESVNEEFVIPKLDYNLLPVEIVKMILIPHVLVKTFLFAPKPDSFLMSDKRRQNTYKWISGLNNQNFFTVVEGAHLARPVSGFTQSTMSLENPSSYYVEEKGTDVNLAAHLLTKAFHNSYDTAVIVSGDTDYIPVMDLLNTIGKNVVVVGVEGQNLSRFKYHTDARLIIDDDFFQRCLRA